MIDPGTFEPDFTADGELHGAAVGEQILPAASTPGGLRFGDRLRHAQEKAAGMPVRLFPGEVLALADAIDRDAAEQDARLQRLLGRCLQWIKAGDEEVFDEGFLSALLTDLRRELVISEDE